MKLETLGELLNFLNPNKRDVKRCLEGMKSLDTNTLKIKDFLFWNEDTYTRNLISKTESFELMVCCWEPGQSSMLHDLNGQIGWIKVLKGDLEFNTLNVNSSSEEVETKKLEKDDLFVHQTKEQMYNIKNSSKERAISLHLYSYPISFYNVLSEVGTDVENINISYYFINGALIK
tara:strand:- start:713 stop:1237 length:525 start_codon:yes stop_codon:yes gene_type:complete